MPDEAPAERGPILLALARQSLVECFRHGGGASPTFASAQRWLAEPRATFVTLFTGEALRGCVGSILAQRSLAEDVWENARAAAFRDVRFPPLEAGELPALRFEISELSPLEDLCCETVEELLGLLRPQVDGLLLQWGRHRGVFLPQVWEHLPDAERFLSELKRKAGLPPEFWAPDVELWRFTVTKWCEPVLAAVGSVRS